MRFRLVPIGHRSNIILQRQEAGLAQLGAFPAQGLNGDTQVLLEACVGRRLERLRDGRPVVGPCNLPSKERAFILTGVSLRGAREFIAGQLNDRGWVEGEDYLLAA